MSNALQKLFKTAVYQIKIWDISYIIVIMSTEFKYEVTLRRESQNKPFGINITGGPAFPGSFVRIVEINDDSLKECHPQL